MKRLLILCILSQCVGIVAQTSGAAKIFEGTWSTQSGDLKMTIIDDSHISCTYAYVTNGHNISGILNGYAQVKYNETNSSYEYYLTGDFSETWEGGNYGGYFEFVIYDSNLNYFHGSFDDIVGDTGEWNGTRR